MNTEDETSAELQRSRQKFKKYNKILDLSLVESYGGKKKVLIYQSIHLLHINRSS